MAGDSGISDFQSVINGMMVVIVPMIGNSYGDVATG